MKEKWKKRICSRMTYAVLLSMLVVGMAALGGRTLEQTLHREDDPYLALEETASPLMYPADSLEEPVIAQPEETLPPEGMVADEETEEVYEVVEWTQEAPKEGDVAQVSEVLVEEETEESDSDSEEPANESKEPEAEDVSSVNAVHFSEEDSLSWPLEGEVIREFSMDTTVYFPTLDSYRVSDALWIQGETGQPVYAAAAGIVKEIGNSLSYGSYMVVDLGDGYELTYGQLQDVALKEGEKMEAGDIIASVAEPSRYYLKEGSHLYFKMNKEEALLDPLNYLQ